MPQMPSFDSWPSHWYNTATYPGAGVHLVCPADDCGRPFSEDRWEDMKAHWKESGAAISPRSLNDHFILRAMSLQTKCVHLDGDGHNCKFEAHGNLRALLNHEQMHHGRTEMSEIGKFLALVRKGVLAFPDESFDVYAFDRLVSKIVELPDLRDAILDFGAQSTSSAMPDEGKPKWIVTFLEQHNQRGGRRRYAVIPQQEFLSHNKPKLEHDGTVWPQAWQDLCSMYEKGTI